MKPVVIVGAGLAGLACARALRRARVPFQLIEADDRIGGRLKTDVVGNYRLDRGYQVYFTAYPTAKEQLDEDKLQLQRFEPGAYIVWDGELHKVSRDNPLQFALSGFLSTADKLRLGRWTSDVQWLDPEDIEDLPDVTAEQYLRDEGFSDDFIERFARPFFGGVFLDRRLNTSSRQLAFVWKAISEGETVVPALGMEEIPKQFGITFGPDVLRLDTQVVEVLTRGGVVAGVKLSDGEVIESDQVVLACDATTAARLSGQDIPVEFNHSITLYFSADQQPVEGAWIVLNGNMRGITHHIVPVSNLNPFTEPIEKHLISATILGERSESDEQLAEIVKAEARIWFPHHDAENWQLIRGYRLKNAQLKQPPGFWEKRPSHISAVEGLYLAGEYTTNSSIDGAIRSGLRCADTVLSQMPASMA